MVLSLILGKGKIKIKQLNRSYDQCPKKHISLKKDTDHSPVVVCNAKIRLQIKLFPK